MSAGGIFDLSGRVIVVTGGNSGIGLAISRALADQGARVVIWGRRDEANRDAVREISGAGGDVSAESVDVSREADVAAAMARVPERFGRLDGLVACAGFARRLGSILDLDRAAYDAVMDVNLYGAVASFREAYRHLQDRGGSLIAVGSLMSRTGLSGLASYAMAKSGLLGLVRATAVEGGRYGIRANLICPGYIHTPPSEIRATDPESPVSKMLDAHAPIARWGRPEDLGGVAVYLMSDAAAYHTGDVLTVDGGVLARAPE